MAATFEIKKGLGTSSASDFSLRNPPRRRTITVYHVVVDGRTLGSFTSYDEAAGWLVRKYGHKLNIVSK